jgi:two-component system, sensor histidine kinase YesM
VIKSIASMTLRTQLVISFLVIILLILILSFGYLYTGIIGIEQKRTEETTINQFKQLEYNITNLSNEVKKASMFLMTDQDVQYFIQKKSNDDFDSVTVQKNVLDKLDSLLSSYEYVKTIYIFKEDGELVGSNGRSIYHENVETGRYPFYQSTLYKKVRNEYSRITWVFGDRRLYPEFNSKVDSDAFMTAAIAIRNYNEYLQGGTIVFNIDENILNDIYKYVSGYKNSRMYIVDESGTVISDNDMTKVGKKSEIYEEINKQMLSGSFTIETGNTGEQVIYYNLKDFNWTFIHEVPVNEYIRDVLTLREQVILIILVSFFAAFILASLWMDRITKPLKIISNAMTKMETGQIGYKIENQPQNEFGILVKHFNKMSGSIEELIGRNQQIEEQKRTFEIQSLQSQINPHFLYNTLNVIKWMAVAQKADNIVDAMTYLGSMLLPVFRNKSPYSGISDEIKYIENYVRLINLRYGDGIKLIFDVEEKVQECKVLKFILQPIVENSIFHGFDNWFKENIITISACMLEDKVEISIEDNGKGINAVKLEETRKYIGEGGNNEKDAGSIGLYNINSRLKLNFGEGSGLELESEEGRGTKVKIKLPIIK